MNRWSPGTCGCGEEVCWPVPSPLDVTTDGFTGYLSFLNSLTRPYAYNGAFGAILAGHQAFKDTLGGHGEFLVRSSDGMGFWRYSDGFGPIFTSGYAAPDPCSPYTWTITGVSGSDGSSEPAATIDIVE